jgi:hypothetical protein
VKWTQHRYSLDAKEDAEDVDIVVSEVFLQSHPKKTRKTQEGVVDDVETKPNQVNHQWLINYHPIIISVCVKLSVNLYIYKTNNYIPEITSVIQL